MHVGRKTCRSHQPCAPETAAQAISCLIQHGALSVQALAGELAARYDIHVTREALYEWSNPYRADKDLSCPARVLLAACLIQESAVLLDYLARQLGYRIEPIGSPEAADAIRLQREQLQATAAIGDVTQAVLDVTADGEISDADRAVLRPVLQRAKREIADVEAMVEAPTPTAAPTPQVVRPPWRARG